MHYRKHVIVNTFFGWLALKLADFPIVFRTLSPAVFVGLLIDVDHFLYHIWRERTLSMRRLVSYVRADWEEQLQRFYPFHTLEFGLIFTIIVYYTPLTWPWAFGYWVHVTTDAYYNYRRRGDIKSWFPKWIGTLQGWRTYKERRERKRALTQAYA